MDLNSLKRHWLYSKFRLTIIIYKLTYDVNTGWETISPLKNYNNFKTWKSIVIFFRLNIVVSISTHVKYHSNIALVLHLYKIGLPLEERTWKVHKKGPPHDLVPLSLINDKLESCRLLQGECNERAPMKQSLSKHCNYFKYSTLEAQLSLTASKWHVVKP